MENPRKCRCLLNDNSNNIPKIWLLVIILYVAVIIFGIIGYLGKLRYLMMFSGILFWPTFFITIVMTCIKAPCMCTCEQLS
jgi:hypothetical protein